ncbi:hypothetical protein [Desulfobulbus alkaliphilus]|uniref:hypothetical protein n=1 Tax=Desulfobulbus alkaliphilus TaxID=869814 RepID=UPI001962B01F|nr:hypothetical protein [Desulfobulbus alkaliphilus]MBM9538855.1 hypothetical protein [Desulfobulbus alkaliphilus]
MYPAAPSPAGYLNKDHSLQPAVVPDTIAGWDEGFAEGREEPATASSRLRIAGNGGCRRNGGLTPSIVPP